MRLAIVSDIHSNLWALNSVLEHIATQKVDKLVCLGDIVGYGPYPNECIEAVVNNFNYIVMGNHDNATFDKVARSGFSPQAKHGVEWTAEKLKHDNLEVLKNLEYGYVTDDGLLFVHGCPHEPFAYLDNYANAYNSFGNPISDFNVAFVGHTHQPIVWEKDSNGEVDRYVIDFKGKPNEISDVEHFIGFNKAIINVGSVGQPRDGDNRACYAIYDTENNHVQYFRIPYPIDRTIAKMQQYGFSSTYWTRLMYGQ